MNTQKVEVKLYELFENFNENSDTKISGDQIIELVDSITEIYKKENTSEKVKEFMIAFEQTVNEKLCFPSKDVIDLRLKLELEETIELAEACGSSTLTNFGLLLKEEAEKIRDFTEKERENLAPNLVKVADALLDKEYIHKGTVHSFGMGNIFDRGFDLVHESNMSKMCSSISEVEMTISYYEKEGIIVVPKVSGNNFLILREQDNKVLKSINYKPVNLNELVYIQKNFV